MADDTVPLGLKIAGAYSWRILLVVGVIAVLIFLIMQFRYIVIPFMIAILVALFAVPVIAVTNVVVKYLASGAWRTTPHPTPEDVIGHA